MVGFVSAVAGGSLVFFYMKTHQPPHQEALALGASPPSVVKQLAAPKVPPPPPVLNVDPATAPLEGFVLGMAEADVAKHGVELNVTFSRVQDNRDHTRVFWDYVAPDKDPRYRSIRLLLASGKLAGTRVKYRVPQPDLLASWQQVLGPAYRDEGGEKHWKLTAFKAKAATNGSKFYEVATDHRDNFAW